MHHVSLSKTIVAAFCPAKFLIKGDPQSEDWCYRNVPIGWTCHVSQGAVADKYVQGTPVELITSRGNLNSMVTIQPQCHSLYHKSHTECFQMNLCLCHEKSVPELQLSIQMELIFKVSILCFVVWFIFIHQ